jgi:hypothetical protein
MTVAELLDRISSKELTEWIAFYSLEPFGYLAEMHGDAITASTIANANRDPKKKAEPFSANDFLPKEEVEDNRTVFQKLKDYLLVNNSQPSSKA